MLTDIPQLERGFVFAMQDDYALDLPGRQEDLAAFLGWLEAEGWPLALKVLTGESFDGDEQPFEKLALAVCVWRADKCIWRDDQGDELKEEDLLYLSFGHQMIKEGQEILRKWYLGTEPSAHEKRRLWAYRLYLDCRILHGPCWPYELGLHRYGEEGSYLPLGEDLGFCAWHPMETFLNSPDYTEAPPEDYFRIIKPEAMDEFAMRVEGYEPHEDEKGRAFVKEKFPVGEPGVVHMESFRGGDKPVLLLLADGMDCFWARVAPMAENLYQAYKDKLHFYWVHTDVVDFLIEGETTVNYFKPHVGRELPGHATSYEDRARTAKKVYMTHPHMTLPCLLDTMGSAGLNLARDLGGGSRVILLDRENRVAWQSTYQWGYWFSKRPPERGCCEHFPWADGVEQAIRKLLANDGFYDPQHEPFDAHDLTNNPLGKQDPAVMYLLKSRVKAIDLDACRLEIVGRPATFTVLDKTPEDKEYFNDPHPMVIGFTEDAVLKLHNKPIPMSELQVDDIIFGPGYVKQSDGSWLASEIQVERKAEGGGAGKLVGDTYLMAHLLRSEDGGLVVKPCLPEQEMKGLRYIREAGDAIELFGRAKGNYEALTAWLDAARDEVVIHLSEDTLLSRHGVPADVADFCKGDLLSIWYRGEQAGQEQIDAALIRASQIAVSQS